MIHGSEKRNGWLDLELQSPHVIERRSKLFASYGKSVTRLQQSYFYFLGCNQTHTTASGTFQSPNYPKKYPDGQYCSWRIMVNEVHKIHLKFTTFSLQTERNTDELYVYDGENAEGEVLGVFYGGHPPPREGIRSSSNTMFVIFKSDKNDSYTGFSASYYAGDNSGKCFINF